MTKQRPILLAGVPTLLEMKLRNLIPEAEWSILPPGVRDVVREASCVAAVVHVGSDAEGAFRLVGDLDRSNVRVVVVGPTKDADLILRALREGAKEFVLAGEDEALARAVREQVKPAGSSDLGAVYAVFAAKGGVGATTIAVNLAGVLRKTGKRVCLVDLNLNMGDALAFLDLAGGYSLSDVLANMKRLDRDLLDSTMLKHASGIHVLSQSHRVEDADKVRPEAMLGALNFLRQHYDVVVLDGLRSFDDLAVGAVDGSDQILLVLTQEVPAVRDARRCIELFRRLGHEQKLHVVVNRFQKQIDITKDVIRETVGLPVSATVANDYPAVIRAINKGVLLADDSPRNAVTKEIEALAILLAPSSGSAAPGDRPSLLKRLFANKVSHAT